MKHFRLLLTLLLFLLTLPGAGVARPVIVPDQSILTLDEIGLYEVGYALRGRAGSAPAGRVDQRIGQPDRRGLSVGGIAERA